MKEEARSSLNCFDEEFGRGMWQSIAGKAKDASPRPIEKSASVDSGRSSSSSSSDRGESNGSSSSGSDATKELERLSVNGKELQAKYRQLSDVYSKMKEENSQMHVVLENLFQKEAAVLSENGNLVAQKEKLRTQLDATLSALVAEKAANDLLQ